MPGKVGTREEWHAARVALLAKEKAHTRAGEKLAEELRSLPMVPVDKTYTFHPSTAPSQTVGLADLFNGKSQLVVYHFMFDPKWDEGCRGCSFLVSNFPELLTQHLGMKDTALAAVSRAPAAKLDAFADKAGWTGLFPWYSSEGSDFNFDFQVTIDESRAEPTYNFATKSQVEGAGKKWQVGESEQPGLSIFYNEGGKLYHTYSTYARGTEKLSPVVAMLDMTPKGRQDGPYGPADYKRKWEYEEIEQKEKDAAKTKLASALGKEQHPEQIVVD